MKKWSLVLLVVLIFSVALDNTAIYTALMINGCGFFV